MVFSTARRYCFLVLLLCSYRTGAQEIKPVFLESSSKICAGQCCCSANLTPIGVMTDHLHPKGEWAFSYNFMNMSMQGNLVGAQSVASETLLNTYMMAPDQMQMQMHMFMGMYGLTNRLTLMTMLHYNRNNMSMVMMPMEQMMNMPGMNMTMMDMPSTCSSTGLGDTKVWALYKLRERGRQRIVLAGGLNLPTGSTRAKGTTLLGENTRLPYMMQLGSGTLDVFPAITYTDGRNKWYWGVNMEGSVPLGTNRQGYAWGPKIKSSAWMSYKWSNWLASSLRVEATAGGKIIGYDPLIAPLMLNDPCADAANTGGKRASAYLGLQFSQLGRILPGASAQIEFGMPFYQNLNGPQMGLRQTLQAGLSYAF
jgi:hypothetical protein